MERIKQALEKARQERLSQQDNPATAASAQPPPAQPEGGSTPVLRVDNALLREHRIIAGMEPGDFTDAYNLLRTQVLQRFSKNNWKVLAVTSPQAGAGKTLTAINLAISMAREVNYTVMLVDANLRHPWMLDHFGLPHRPGLSEYLTGNTPLHELMFRIEGIDQLVVLPGGKPLTNSAEMLNSPKMTQLVNELRTRYQDRVIIIDLPPVHGSADTVSFVPQVDATLLVVEEGATGKQELADAAGLLGNTSIIGTVLNKAGDRSKT